MSTAAGTADRPDAACIAPVAADRKAAGDVPPADPDASFGRVESVLVSPLDNCCTVRQGTGR